MAEITITTPSEAELQLNLVRASAARTREWLRAHDGDPMSLMRAIKFDPVGWHPVEDRALNLIEQVNQTWTYAVAILAARQLLDMHPEAKGYRIAPGAHKALALDVMSVEPGLVGAETFAAVTPRNNNKLSGDLTKLAGMSELHRYVFLMCPQFTKPGRVTSLERDGIQVWAVTLN